METVTEKIKTDNETIKSIDNNSIAMNNTSSAVDKVNIKPIEKKEQTAAVKPKQKENKAPAPVVVKEYAVLFENINENQYTKVKDLSKKYNTKLEVVDAYSNTYSIWKVYEQNDAGSEVVDAVAVTHVEDFLTQEDAVEFAAKRNIKAVIKQIGVTEKSYNIKLCCTNIDNAKKIANGSSITDKIIKIIRQK